MLNNKINKKYIKFVLIAFFIFLSFILYGVLDAWFDSTGFLEIHQLSISSQEEEFPSTPKGTLPINSDLPEVNTREEANLLKNPHKNSMSYFKQGRKLYQYYCAPCHGADGDGIGIMGSVASLGLISQSEKKDLSNYLSGFIGKEDKADLDYFRKSLDQQLYYTITQGGETIMPGFKDAMNQNERWILVTYIKKGLNSSD